MRYNVGDKVHWFELGSLHPGDIGVFFLSGVVVECLATTCDVRPTEGCARMVDHTQIATTYQEAKEKCIAQLERDKAEWNRKYNEEIRRLKG